MENIVSVVEILTTYANMVLTTLPKLIIAMIVFFIFWILSKVTNKGVRTIVDKTVDDKSLRNLFTSLFSAAVIVIGVLVSAAIVFPGLNAGSLISVLGLSSVAVGFAFKDIFQNFFAGVLLLARRPFHIGDQIVAGSKHLEGFVHDISFRHTTIRTYGNQHILIPNAQIFTNHVVVRNAEKTVRSAFFTGIAYNANIDEAKTTIIEAIKACTNIHQSPEPGVYVNAHGDSAITLEILFWHDSGAMPTRLARDDVATRVKYALDEANISIPFPQRTLHLSQNTLDGLKDSTNHH